MIRETTTGVVYDQLLGGPEIPVLTANVTVTGGKTLKRGSLLKAEGGKYSLVGTGDRASVVLKEDVDATTDTVAVVYTSGRFNRDYLIVADGDNVGAHEEELRTVNIILTSVLK